MPVSSTTLGLLLDAGLSGDQLRAVVAAIDADMDLIGHSTRQPSDEKRADRNRRYYASKRLKASESVLNQDVLNPSENVLKRLESTRSRVRGNLHREGVTGKKENKTLSSDSAFSVFWSAYPRKIGKGAARKSFDRAVHRIAGADPPAMIIVALETAKRAWAKRNEPEFIPHPATWLNQDRWEDEPEASTVIAFVPPPLTPQQQADLERINAERRHSTQAGLRPLDALGAVAGGG